MSGRRATRRAFLGALGLGAASACLLPSQPPPKIIPGPWGGPIPRPRGTGLLAGAAQIDLTPPRGMPIWLAGFGFQRKMRGIRDPISAQCLVFDDGTQRIALLAADLIGLMRPSVERVRQMVGADVHVTIASTHNHAGPDTIGFWGPSLLHVVPHKSGIEPRYLTELERRLAVVVRRAAARARPAELRLARAALPKGVAKNLRPPFEAPEDLQVIEAIDAGDGTTIAVLVRFACHAETAGHRTHQLSADFPGALRQRLHELKGGVPIFINGSLGGMVVPDIDDAFSIEERSQAIDRIGALAAEGAKEAFAKARVISPRPMALHRLEVEVPFTNSLMNQIERLGLVETRPRGPSGVITEVGRLDLGPLSLALLPGEPTPLVGRQVEAQLRGLGAEDTGVIGLANDELGYLLDPSAEFDHSEFGYEVSMSPGRETVPLLLAALQKLPPRKA